MSPTLKKWLRLVFVLVSILAVSWIAFGKTEMTDAWKGLAAMDGRWLAALILCWAAYVFFDTLSSWLYLRSSKQPTTFFQMLSITLIGLYYSNITPGAAGGQPMQVNALRKTGVPVGIGTTAVTCRLIANQLTMTVMTLVLGFNHRDFLLEHLGSAIWFVRIGWMINFAVVPIVLLSGFKRRWMQRLAEGLVKVLSKIRLIRYPDKTTAGITQVMDMYHHAMIDLLHSPRTVLIQIGCSVLCMLGLCGSIGVIYHSFGLSGTSWGTLLTLGCALFVSASYTPLPGASGAQEGGFLFYFHGIFPEDQIGLALLIWRFFNYYVFLLIGVMVVAGEKALLRGRKQRVDEDEAG